MNAPTPQEQPDGHTKGLEGTLNPRKLGVDYVYNPEDWETTWPADEIEEIEQNLQESGPGAVMTVATLIQGPTLHAVRLVSERDDEGEPTDYEVRFFGTSEEAYAAIAKALGQ